MPNLTIDLAFWFTMLKFVIMLSLGFKLAHSIYHAVNKVKNISTDFKVADVVWRPAIWFVLFIIAVFFAFIAIGPGTSPVITSPEEDGMRQLVEQAPAEKSPEILKKEAYDAKPKELKRQDSTWHKEADEADAYLKKALEEVKK